MAFSEFFWSKGSKVKDTSELMVPSSYHFWNSEFETSCRTSAINWWPKGWWIMCFLDISAAYFAMGRLAPERPPPSWERLGTWWDVVGSTKCWVHLVSKPLASGRLRFFSSAESTYLTSNIRQIPANFPLPPTRQASLEPRFQVSYCIPKCKCATPCCYQVWQKNWKPFEFPGWLRMIFNSHFHYGAIRLHYESLFDDVLRGWTSFGAGPPFAPYEWPFYRDTLLKVINFCQCTSGNQHVYDIYKVVKKSHPFSILLFVDFFLQLPLEQPGAFLKSSTNQLESRVWRTSFIAVRMTTLQNEGSEVHCKVQMLEAQNTRWNWRNDTGRFGGGCRGCRESPYGESPQQWWKRLPPHESRSIMKRYGICWYRWTAAWQHFAPCHRGTPEYGTYLKKANVFSAFHFCEAKRTRMVPKQRGNIQKYMCIQSSACNLGWWCFCFYVFVISIIPSFPSIFLLEILLFYYTEESQWRKSRFRISSLWMISKGNSPIIRAIESVEVCEGRRRWAGGFIWKLRAAYRVFWLPVGRIPELVAAVKGPKSSVYFCKQVEGLELRSLLGNSSWSSLSFFVCFFVAVQSVVDDCCCRPRRR